MVACLGLVGCDQQKRTEGPGQAATIGPTSERAELCSGANIVGVGLRAEYFAGAHRQGEPMLVRTDASIDFVGLADLPAEARTGLPGSVRWSGWIKAPTSGAYRFHLRPEGARLSVSRQVIRAAESPAESEPVEMVSGRFYPIVVEIDELRQAELPVRMEWTAPHGARYLVPRALLNLPTETVVAPAPTPAR